MNRLEADLPFCSNPDCILHVHAGDPGVIGIGNWAKLADGTLIGRGIYYGLYLCDPCGHAWQRVPFPREVT